MKSLIFVVCVLFVACYDGIQDKHEELCYRGEKVGCILYDGGCYDGPDEVYDVKYSRCCDGKYVEYKYEGCIYYSIDAMYEDVCNF